MCLATGPTREEDSSYVITGSKDHYIKVRVITREEDSSYVITGSKDHYIKVRVITSQRWAKLRHSPHFSQNHGI